MPVDYANERRNMAMKVIDATKALVDAVHTLNLLGPELDRKGGAFEPADFDGRPDLAYLDADTINTLVKVVAPTLMAFAGSPVAQGDARSNGDVLFAVKRT